MKAYNIIFPLWMLYLFPPFLLIAAVGNFIIDSLVVFLCFYEFKTIKADLTLKSFYKKSILAVWFFGFLADFIGSVLLITLNFLEDRLGLSYEFTYAVAYDPFSHPLAVVVICIAMLVSGFFIFFFNYRFTFRTIIKEKTTRVKVALTIAIITIPWTFLLPAKWIYGEY